MICYYCEDKGYVLTQRTPTYGQYCFCEIGKYRKELEFDNNDGLIKDDDFNKMVKLKAFW